MDNETIIDLLLFLKDKEYRIENDESITTWINFDDIQEFTNIMGESYFCEEGIEVTLLCECITFNLHDFIEGMGEDTNLIMKKLKEFRR